jgi:tripartite-type tricarboxylate transporter receptor subunit TctC
VLPAGLAVAQPAAKQEMAGATAYPQRSVRLLVPFSPGGGTDIIARVTSLKVSDAWGQPIVVDNRTGGGGIIAAQTVATAVADGYTLLMPSISIAYTPAIYSKLPYDTDKDLVPVMLIATQQNLLVVNPSVPVKSVLELVALAKAKPGEIRVATGGAGASDHLAMELFQMSAGLKLVNIPYKGQVPGTNALIGGEVHMQISPMASLYPHVQSGKLRGLAVTGSARARTAPELPTIAEAGLPGYEFYVWYALLAPAGTPRPVISKINEGFNRALNAPEVRDRLASIGIDALGGTQEKFAAFLKSEMSKWSKVAKQANIKVD